MIGKIGRFISILIIVSIFVSLTFITEVNAIKNLPEGTSVSGISLSNKSVKEAIVTIEQEIEQWQSGESLILKSDYQQLTIPREAFLFDLDRTIAELKKNMKRKWMNFFQRPKDVAVTLFISVDDDHPAINHLEKQSHYINTDNMVSQLETLVSELNDEPLTIDYVNKTELPFETVAEIEVDRPNLSEVIMTYVLNSLDRQTIYGHDSFSVLEVVDFNENIMTSTDELDVVASALYSLFLETNFPIVERHAQLNSPTYWKKGTDVRLSYEEHKDLVVINPNSQAFKLVTEETSDKIKLQLQAVDYDTPATYTVEQGDDIKARTIYRYTKDMKPGDYMVIQSGQDGGTVHVYRDVDGEKEKVSEDVYLPVPRIVLAATRDAIPETERDDTEDEEAIIIGDSELEEKLDEAQQLVKDLQYLFSFYDYYLDALMYEYEVELIEYTTFVNEVELLQTEFDEWKNEEGQVNLEDFLQLQNKVDELNEALNAMQVEEEG